MKIEIYPGMNSSMKFAKIRKLQIAIFEFSRRAQQELRKICSRAQSWTEVVGLFGTPTPLDFFNPLSAKSDQHQISPNNNNT